MAGYSEKASGHMEGELEEKEARGMMESSPSLKSGAVARQEPKHADGGGTAVGTGGR